MTDILKILSPFAALGFFWTIYQFYAKRKHEKEDKEKEFKLKILTDFLTEINDLRILSTEIFNYFNKRTKRLKVALTEYRNDKIVNQFADKSVDSQELKNTFKNLTLEEQKEFIEKSEYFFRTGNETDVELFDFLKNKNKELEIKALSLNKIPLLNLIASKELIDKREKIIDSINGLVSLDYAEGSTDVDHYFDHRMEIFRLSFEIEYLVLAEIKKL